MCFRFVIFATCLRRTCGIEIAKSHEFQSICRVIVGKQSLEKQLGPSVRTRRLLPGVFFDGQVFGFAIDSAARGEYKAPHTGLLAGNLLRRSLFPRYSENIVLDPRPIPPHTRRLQSEYRTRVYARGRSAQGAPGRLCRLGKRQPWIQRLPVAARQIIQHHYLFSSRNQVVDRHATDVPRASRD